jgi:hypothetical protein
MGNMNEPEDARPMVLASAASKGARLLGLSPEELSAILGCDLATSVAVLDGTHAGDVPHSIALFVQLVQRLVALVGGDEYAAAAWLRSPNHALGKVPIQLCMTPDGLSSCVDYLRAVR